MALRQPGELSSAERRNENAPRQQEAGRLPKGAGSFELGGDDMRILAKTCVILAVCLTATRGATAVDWSEPFVAITVPRGPVHLGEVPGVGVKEVGARLTAHVVANCPHRILASFDGLRHQVHNVPIAPKDMTVMINGAQVPVGTARVPIASNGPTPRNGVDVPIEMQVGVRTKASYPAGPYCGTLVITITAGY